MGIASQAVFLSQQTKRIGLFRVVKQSNSFTQILTQWQLAPERDRKIEYVVFKICEHASRLHMLANLYLPSATLVQ